MRAIILQILLCFSLSSTFRRRYWNWFSCWCLLWLRLRVWTMRELLIIILLSIILLLLRLSLVLFLIWVFLSLWFRLRTAVLILLKLLFMLSLFKRIDFLDIFLLVLNKIGSLLFFDETVKDWAAWRLLCLLLLSLNCLGILWFIAAATTDAADFA